MADDVNVSASTSTTPPPAASTQAPIVSSPAPAPAVEAPAPAPVETPAPAVEAPVTTPAQAPEAPKSAVTPLGGLPEPVVAPAAEGATSETKAGEKPAEEAVKKEEGSQSAEPAQLPTFEPFNLPEGIVPDADGFGNLTKMLGEFENLTKADHAEVQKFGQGLVDRHVGQLNKTIQKVAEFWTTNWEKQKTDWFEKFKADPEIGGNRMDTTVAAARQFIVTHGGTPEQQQEFRELMNASGVGNHPAMIRMLAKANLALSEGKPLPAATPMGEKKGKVQTLYGGAR